MPEVHTEDGTTFVRVTNAEIWAEVQDLKEKVTALNIKFYGMLGGLLTSIAAILHQGGVFS